MAKPRVGDLITLRVYGIKDSRFIIKEVGEKITGVELTPDNIPQFVNDKITMKGRELKFEFNSLFKLGFSQMLFKNDKALNKVNRNFLKKVNHFKTIIR